MVNCGGRDWRRGRMADTWLLCPERVPLGVLSVPKSGSIAVANWVADMDNLLGPNAREAAPSSPASPRRQSASQLHKLDAGAKGHSTERFTSRSEGGALRRTLSAL